jgi:predicted aconitase
LHVRANRRGTHVVEVAASLRDVHDWDLLGFAIGERVPTGGVPVLVGDFEPPGLEALKSAFASMATSGSVEMCHIVGLTPEAPTLEDALHRREPEACLRVTDADLVDVRDRVSEHGKAQVGFVSLGCPHYSLQQIQYVASRIAGKRVHPSVKFQVWTAIPIKEAAKRSGLVELIEGAGGAVLTSTCPLVSQTIPDVSAMAFDSVKQGRYVSSCTQAKVFVGSVDECLEAALTGVWKGRMA